MKAEGGAVAVWASSGMTLPGDQAAMNQEMFRTLFNKKTNSSTLGEAARRAKAPINDIDVWMTWTLLGDPTIVSYISIAACYHIFKARMV